MNRSTRRLITWVIIVSALLALLAFSNNLIHFYTEWLWFAEVDQLSTYQTRIWSRVGLFLGSALLVIGVLVVNWLLVPRRQLGRINLPLRGRDKQTLTIGARPLTAILGLIITAVTLVMALAATDQWMTLQRALHATPFGLEDPIFGRDVGFYIFQLPLYRFLVGWGLGLIVVSALGVTLIYLFANQIREQRALTHLSILGALFLLGKAVDYQIQRMDLLTASEGVVFGAGYTDVHARLPLLQILTGVVILGALLLLVNLFIRRGRLLLAVGGAWLAISILGPFYPTAVQRLTVQPNERALESPYIEHNIRLTRYAYGLQDVKASDYAVQGVLTAQKLEDNEDTLRNVRLWDWRPLRTTYEQLQEIRTYYTFADVDIDRYALDGGLRQITLAVRELDIQQLREEARTWVNEHLIYTHGYGLCLSPVSEVSEEGLPNFLVRDIPPKSTHPELEITRPEIYFGEETNNYIIVNTSEDEFDYPRGDQNVYARYEGPAGVPMGGLLRRLAFALRFESTPIMLSRALSPESRIIYHRAIGDRVRNLAPMLWFDDDPYPAIVDGRIVWLYDAYTWSARFPYAQPAANTELNYIRNSVKVTIDAYTGAVTFYVIDPSDPLIQTYRAIFPELFEDGAEMDEALRAHWRYPEQLFLIQAEIYAAYHMEDPRVFYNQEDLWQTPMEIRERGEALMSPYYVTMRLPGTEQVEFLMIRPYVPANKQNMIAWLYADSDGDDYGQLGVYKFSKEALVYGPMQIEARLDQDPYISQQLTLWNQRGSSVIRGNLIVIPINGTLLYVEPLYLQAESGRLPELTRVLVAHGNRVAMADDLAQGLAQVLGQEEAEPPPDVEALPTDVKELAISAQGHYEAAQACLQRGDWACYGDELEAMAGDLEALIIATEEQAP